MAFALWPTLGPQRQQTIGTMVHTAKEPSHKKLLEMAQRAAIQPPAN